MDELGSAMLKLAIVADLFIDESAAIMAAPLFGLELLLLASDGLAID